MVRGVIYARNHDIHARMHAHFCCSCSFSVSPPPASHCSSIMGGLFSADHVVSVTAIVCHNRWIAPAGTRGVVYAIDNENYHSVMIGRWGTSSCRRILMTEELFHQHYRRVPPKHCCSLFCCACVGKPSDDEEDAPCSDTYQQQIPPPGGI